MSLNGQKLLIANRGEIAVRILRTATKLGIPTVAVYTRSDATSPHVLLADEAVPLRADDVDSLSSSRGYLDAAAIVDICKARNVTLVHPGYGFLAENAPFAAELEQNGVTWLGPDAKTIRAMGLKHEARAAATRANVPIVPGSDGLVADADAASNIAARIGFPVMLKSTAGGGGMGLVVCQDESEVRAKLEATQQRAKSLFHDSGVFIEKYIPDGRHIEIQVFGNGLGHVVHMGERECSIQRRYQKVIEETPSPFLIEHPGIREKMCEAAVRLCREIRYNSAGTVEFIVDDRTGDFFFLEMNTRIQVEHTVTEVAHPGLDIVELMILQGVAQRTVAETTQAPALLDQQAYTTSNLHVIEARIYCENPTANFKPSPGLLQHVAFPSRAWLRVDTWINTGTAVTPFFDPLVAKLIVSGETRRQAIERLREALSETKVYGPPNNIAYLQAICQSEVFQRGKATAKFLDTFDYKPRVVDVLSGGLETTVQDYPGRLLGRGLPRSGPMDSLAYRAANILVGNAPGTEALEITLVGCRLLFRVPALVAITGAEVKVTVDGQPVKMWGRVHVPAGGKLSVGTVGERGFRVYLAVKGGFPEVPSYLGSKATSMGLGGYQGRALTAGDQFALGNCAYFVGDLPSSLPLSMRPSYPSHWMLHALSGPHCDEAFITRAGIAAFFATSWKVSPASNRMGIRLEGPPIDWARANGGEGGSHPSNIHDNGYALGTVNVNGDTPVLLTNEGPDMGGYLCVCTVATADLWKLGQLRPGDTVQFVRISFEQAMALSAMTVEYLDQTSLPASMMADEPVPLFSTAFEDTPQDPQLHVVPARGSRPSAVFRQAGDSAILVEFGELLLDFHVRARVHAFEQDLAAREVAGVWSMAPCIRSTMIHFDPTVVSQSDLLAVLVEVEASLPDSMADTCFPGRKITFPIVLDDRWSREALERYMRSMRDEAVYLPSNIEYLARNNGLEGGAQEALRLLVQTDWLVFGVGFYLACPFLVPIDPRCRLVGQKMNPSRTYTPRGAIAIAGLVAAIYPIESPGGYQLYGRTLSPWQTWGRGEGLTPEQPWLLQPFDQVKFKAVSEEEYIEIERRLDSGQYQFEVEPVTFSMAEYDTFVDSLQDQVVAFKHKQAEGTAREEVREAQMLHKWQQRKSEEKAAQGNVGISQVSGDDGAGSSSVKSSLTASVWKVTCEPGYVVRAAEDVLLVLEAMKTEVNVEAGEENVGKVVRNFGTHVRPGALVQAGDILVTLK
ncbi:urea carboxylase [Phanerochaete sordida]|uniref:Urea carboxylase n=1 Tax=Phanerochaete sordida TaxID=48140 RepID=A0A9P3LLX3_9APHY|nr:urea carboxylase [Phanerochaete sordida]